MKRATLRRKWSTILKAGWSWGCISAIDCEGRTIWIVDAHRGDGRRFIVRAEELLSAFVELEREVLTVTFISNPFLPIRAGDHDDYRNQTVQKRLASVRESR